MSTEKLQRWWVPNTLFGRLVVVLVSGLFIAQLLGAYILLRDRTSSLYETSGWYTAQRFASIVELMDTLPSAQRQLVVKSLNTATLRITIEAAPKLPATTSDPHAVQLHALLMRELGQRPVNVSILDWNESALTTMPGMGEMPMMHSMQMHQMMMGAGPAAFDVEAQLHDGEWVSMLQQLPADKFQLHDKLLATLAVLLLSVVGLSLWVVRGVTQPLVTLGQAAEALGRDINHSPLNENEGPREVRRAAQAFNTMQTRVTHYIQDRERFLAAVSHDLKTPITRLRLRAELLNDAALRERILKDLKDMETMTIATLDFIRGEQQREESKMVDIVALLESLQEDRQAMGQQITLSGTAQPYRGQPLSLRRCLDNIIENAIKYGNLADVVIEDSAQQLVIHIHDHGPGIPDKQLEAVFKPFYRLEESRNRETGGVGLGLSIARSIARAHGGDLTLANHPDSGLNVTLVLPR